MKYVITAVVLAVATVTVFTQRLPPQCIGVQCISGSCNITVAGVAFCQCDDGYKPSKIVNVCEDIDECKASTTPLCSPYYCCNEPGAFVCSPSPCKYRYLQRRPFQNNNNLLYLLLLGGETKK